MTSKLLVNGSIINTLRDPLSCEWDHPPTPDRTHSGAMQSQDFVGVKYIWPPLPRAEIDALVDLLEALVAGASAGRITSLTAIGRHYEDPANWVTFTQIDSRGMWPEYPEFTLKYHLVMHSSGTGGPTWYIAHVTPAWG